jgi:hypothetical protein
VKLEMLEENKANSSKRGSLIFSKRKREELYRESEIMMNEIN